MDFEKPLASPKPSAEVTAPKNIESLDKRNRLRKIEKRIKFLDDEIAKADAEIDLLSLDRGGNLNLQPKATPDLSNLDLGDLDELKSIRSQIEAASGNGEVSDKNKEGVGKPQRQIVYRYAQEAGFINRIKSWVSNKLK